MRVKLTATSLVLHCLTAVATVAAGQHHTVRFVYNSGVAQTPRELTFAPDGSELAVCTTADYVSFIRTSDGEITKRFKLTPFSMAYSRDGSRFFMISEYGSELLDVATGRPIKFETRQETGYVGVSVERRNGKLLISQIQSGGPIERLGEIRVGDELVGIGQSKAGRLYDLVGSRVTPATKMLQGPAGTHVRLRVIPKGQLRPVTHTVMRQPKKLVGGKMAFVAYQGDSVGDNVVWCIWNDRHAFIDVKSGKTIAAIETEHIKSVGQYAISPDSSKFAVLSYLREGEGSAIEVFDIATQRRDALIEFPIDTWLAMAFSQDSSRLLIGTWYTVEILDWQAQRYLEPLTLGQPPVEGVEEVGGPDGAAAGGAAVRAAALGQGIPGFTPRQHVECIAASARGVLAVGNRGKVTLFNIEGRKQLTTLDTFTEHTIKQLRFSPDGKWLAYFCDGVLHIVDVGDVQEVGSVAAK